MKRPRTITFIAVLLMMSAVGTLLFWVVFFADLEAQHDSYLASRCAAWFSWEISFPLPDAWMALTALLGALGLWRQRPYGLLFSLLSCGAMVFLGLIDILFFVQNDLYLPFHSETIVEALIHVWTSVFGLAAIWPIWSQRRYLGC